MEEPKRKDALLRVVIHKTNVASSTQIWKSTAVWSKEGFHCEQPVAYCLLVKNSIFLKVQPSLLIDKTLVIQINQAIGWFIKYDLAVSQDLIRGVATTKFLLLPFDPSRFFKGGGFVNFIRHKDAMAQVVIPSVQISAGAFISNLQSSLISGFNSKNLI